MSTSIVIGNETAVTRRKSKAVKERKSSISSFIESLQSEMPETDNVPRSWVCVVYTDDLLEQPVV